MKRSKLWTLWPPKVVKSTHTVPCALNFQKCFEWGHCTRPMDLHPQSAMDESAVTCPKLAWLWHATASDAKTKT